MGLSIAQAQETLLDSIIVPEGCTEMALDEELNLILLNPEEGFIHKVLAPKYDSVITAGGRGVRTEGLLAPTRLEVLSRQRIYVLDEAQRRASVLSANLRPSEAVDFLAPDRPDVGVDYPIDIAVSTAGELYVLDGLNGKVYMYDPFGRFRLNFGGQDYGDGALFSPFAIDIDQTTRQVWVLDSSKHIAQVYSRFGEYLFSQAYPSKSIITDFTMSASWRVFWGKKNIIIQQAKSTSFENRIKLEGPSNASVCIAGNKLYVLRGNTVHLQSIE